MSQAAHPRGVLIVDDDRHIRDILRELFLSSGYDARVAADGKEGLEVFDAEGVDAAFVFIFALYDHLHRPDGDPREDLDLASYGIVKVFEDRHGQAYPDMAWEPKAAFRMLADYYSMAMPPWRAARTR